MMMTMMMMPLQDEAAAFSGRFTRSASTSSDSITRRFTVSGIPQDSQAGCLRG